MNKAVAISPIPAEASDKPLLTVLTRAALAGSLVKGYVVGEIAKSMQIGVVTYEASWLVRVLVV